MPALLPTDLMAGLNQVNVLDPIQAAQARAILEQTQLKNQGIPAENQRTILENLGIPAKNAQVVKQNTGLDNTNNRYAQMTPEEVAQAKIKTLSDQADLPTHQYEGDVSTVKKNALDDFMKGFGNQPSQEMNGQGPLQSLMNPQPQSEQSIGAQAAGSVIPGSAQGQSGSMLDRLQGMDVNQLRQLSTKNQQMGGALTQFIDPALKYKSETDEVKPALQEIAAVAAQPAKTEEQKRQQIAALSNIEAKYSLVAADPRIKEAITTAKGEKANVVFNMAPYAAPSQASQNAWVDLLGSKQTDIPSFMSAFSGIRGPNREATIAKVLTDTKLKYPDFDLVGAKVGVKAAEDGQNQKTLGLIQSVLPNMEKLVALSDKISRSNISLVNKGMLATDRQFTNQDLAAFDILKTLSSDEINNIFAGGKGGSDKSRDMALSLFNEDLPPKKFAAMLPIVYRAMKNRAAGIQSTFRGYGAQPASAASPGASQYAPEIVAKAKIYAALPANDSRRTPDHDAKVKEILGQ